MLADMGHSCLIYLTSDGGDKSQLICLTLQYLDTRDVYDDAVVGYTLRSNWLLLSTQGTKVEIRLPTRHHRHLLWNLT